MKNKLLAWLIAQDGVTGIEYAVIAGGIGFSLLAGVTVFSDQFNLMQDTISSYMTGTVTKIG